jgi:hypothetical protein
MKPFLKLQDKRRSFRITAEFNECSCGGEGGDFWDLLFPVTKDESFKIGLLMVV